MTLAACSIMTIGYGQNTTNPCDGLVPTFTTVVMPAAGGIKFSDVTVFQGTPSLTYDWSFGNGNTSTEQHPFMMYEEGTYTVKLTVSDDNGCVKVFEEEVEFSYGGQ